jgi:hypothetical protein
MLGEFLLRPMVPVILVELVPIEPGGDRSERGDDGGGHVTVEPCRVRSLDGPPAC